MIEPWLVSENLLSPLNANYAMFMQSHVHTPEGSWSVYVEAGFSKLLKQILTCCQHNNVNKMTLHFLWQRGILYSPNRKSFNKIPPKLSTLSQSVTPFLQSAWQLPWNKLKCMNWKCKCIPTHSKKFSVLNVCCNNCSRCVGQSYCRGIFY